MEIYFQRNDNNTTFNGSNEYSYSYSYNYLKHCSTNSSWLLNNITSGIIFSDPLIFYRLLKSNFASYLKIFAQPI